MIIKVCSSSRFGAELSTISVLLDVLIVLPEEVMF